MDPVIDDGIPTPPHMEVENEPTPGRPPPPEEEPPFSPAPPPPPGRRKPFKFKIKKKLNEWLLPNSTICRYVDICVIIA